MKKLINTAQTLLADALRGIAAAHTELAVDFENRIVFSTAAREGRVALVSGGGSGHEPLHSGFVGAGMLDAACAGEIFTSPTPDQILAAASRVDSGSGVLFVVKNYTGDLLNSKWRPNSPVNKASKLRQSSLPTTSPSKTRPGQLADAASEPR